MSNADKEASCYKIKCVHGDAFRICIGTDCKSPYSINLCILEKKDANYEKSLCLNIDSRSSEELSIGLLEAGFMLKTMDAIKKSIELTVNSLSKGAEALKGAMKEGVV